MRMFKTLSRTLIGAALLLVCAQTGVKGQCQGTSLNITTNVSSGDRCGSNTESFAISNPPQYDQIRWVWGDGNTRTSPNTSESYNYQNPGSYSPTVEFLDANGDVICEVSVSSDISIFEGPTADFNIDTRKFQCIQENAYEFSDQSSEGDAPITDWNWTFGDGNSSNQQNPTYSYGKGGEFPPVLQVTDANGCTDLKSLSGEPIVVTEEINPSLGKRYLTNNGNPTCPETEVEFRNLTPDQGRVDEYTFSPGDGSGAQSLPVPWNTINHTYEDDGTFTATLEVVDTNGCNETASIDAENIDFDFDKNVLVGDSIKCISENTFTFNHSIRPRANEVTWNFKHQPQPDPEVLNEWAFGHNYGSNNGIFGVDLEIKESDDCIKDTTYENVVGIEGPVANIQHPMINNGSPPNTIVGPTDNIIPPDSFKTINKSDCGIEEVEYLPVPDPSATPVTWQRGDPIPNDTVYGLQEGTFNFQNVHDTDIYHRSCEAPNFVRFTNNSVKFRLDRDSTGQVVSPMQATTFSDDQTRPLTPANAVPDPGGDWGSDSLQYLWNFSDPSGVETCTTQYAWQSAKMDGLYEQQFTKIAFGPDDPVLIGEAGNNFDAAHDGHVYVYNESGDSVVFEIGDDFEAFIGPPGNKGTSDSLYLDWNVSPGTGSDSLLVEYFLIDTTGNSAKCNYSTASAPYHLFDTTQCFQPQLEAYDSVTGCESTASIQIYTTPPNAGWERSFYESERNLTYQNYNGQDSIAFDSLLNWTSPVNNVPVRQLLASRVLKDKDITVFDNNGLPVNSSDYEVVNYDLAWLKFTGSKPPNGDVQILYTAKQPEIFPNGDTVTIDTMTHSTQLRLDAIYGNDGPRRGVFLEGENCEGADQTLQQLEGTYPTAECGGYGRDFGFVPDKEAFTDTVTCVDSIDTNNDGEFDATKTRQKQQSQWVPGNQVVSNPMAWNWEFQYGTPGCKTLGLWMQTGDCYDTFWYENYKYIAGNDPEQELLDFEDKEAYTDEEIEAGFCIGENGSGVIGKDSFTLLGKPALIDQQDITGYRFTLSSVDPFISEEDYTFELGRDSIIDTVYRFCQGNIGTEPDGQGGTRRVCSGELVNYPQRTCGPAITDGLSLQDMYDSDDFNIYDSLYIINLADTAQLSIKEPGVYRRNSRIENAQRCVNETNIDEPLYVGHYSNYDSYVPGRQNSDSTVCVGDTVFFKNPDAGPGNYFYYVDHHLPIYFNRHEVEIGDRTEIRNLREDRLFQDPKARDADLGDGYEYEQVEYDLNDDGYYETRYDIDKLLFVQDKDQDSTFETTLQPRDVNNDDEVDTVPYYVYEESGVYDISLKSTDSAGCEQIRRQEEKIVVTDIKAYMGLDEVPGVCAPQNLNFKDSSVIENAFRYTYDDNGNKIDSTRVDSTVDWAWTFTDERNETATKQNPEYVFTRNGSFEGRFIATTATGCSDTASEIIQPTPEADEPPDTVNSIDLLGPKPGFVIQDAKGCEPHTVPFRDTSERVSQWTFLKGDGNQANFDNLPGDSVFNVKYDSSGIYYVKLLAEETVPNRATADDDSISCSITYPDTTERSGKPLEEYEGARVWVKETNLANFSIENDPLCPGEPLLVTNESDNNYDSFDFAMGNGDTVTTYTDIETDSSQFGDTSIIVTDTTLPVGEGEKVGAADTAFVADSLIEFDFSPGDTLIGYSYRDNRVADTTFQYDYGVNADDSFTIKVFPMGNDSLCFDTMTKSIETGAIKAGLDTLPSREPIFRFTNQSENADEYEWLFPDGTIEDSVTAENWDQVKDDVTSGGIGFRPNMDVAENVRDDYENGVIETTDPNLEPELDYRSDNGEYDVCILARRNDYDCGQVECMTIRNTFDTNFKKANVLTPNGDGKNDRLEFELEGTVDFSLKIYNRWGDVVYETQQGKSNYQCEEAGGGNRRCEFWDGRKNNSGNGASSGTYYYALEYQLRDGETQKETGVITLIR